MKTRLNDIKMKIQKATSIESISFSKRFAENLWRLPLLFTKILALESYR